MDYKKDYKNQSINDRLGLGNAEIDSRRQFLKDAALVLAGGAAGISCSLNKSESYVNKPESYVNKPESYEDQIYEVIKKSITENKPSDMAVSLTYCSKGAVTLLDVLNELKKGKNHQKWPSQSSKLDELTEILDSEGFYVTIKSSGNLANNIAIESVYFNHPELKDVAFSFKKNGNEVEIKLGQGRDYAVVYKKDDKTVKRFSGDPNSDLPFEEIHVDEKKIERYCDLVEKIQEKFTTSSHKKE